MAKPITSGLEPFFEGYREQEQKLKTGKPVQAAGAEAVLDLFAKKKVNSMTVFEISAELAMAPGAVTRLTDDLLQRKLVTIEPAPEGNDVVTLTGRGKLFLS